VTEPEQIKALHVIVSWHVILPVAPSIVIRFEPQVAKETFLPEVDPQLVWNDKSLFGTLWCIRISRPDNLNPLKKSIISRCTSSPNIKRRAWIRWDCSNINRTI
jgi:hypothetical protein